MKTLQIALKYDPFFLSWSGAGDMRDMKFCGEVVKQIGIDHHHNTSIYVLDVHTSPSKGFRKINLVKDDNMFRMWHWAICGIDSGNDPNIFYGNKIDQTIDEMLGGVTTGALYFKFTKI